MRFLILFLFVSPCLCISDLGIPLTSFVSDDLVSSKPPVPLQPEPTNHSPSLAKLLKDKFLWNAFASGKRELEKTRIADEAADRTRPPSIRGTLVSELFCDAYMGNITEESRRLAETAFITVGAAKYLSDLSEGARDLRDTIATLDILDEHDCPKRAAQTNCLGLRYRSIDGVCNNIENPWWGAANEPFAYPLKPDYDDLIQSIRDTSVTGSALAPAHLISQIVHSFPEGVERQLETGVSRWFVTYGFFVYEDMNHLTLWRTGTFNCIDCCQPSNAAHPQCALTVNSPCLTPRTLPGLGADCKLRPRAPANVRTSYLDGSAIYGSTIEHANSLRTYELGQLKTGGYGPEPLPPALPYDPASCRSGSEHLPCFDFGSFGMNILADTAALGALFIRHHNALAQELYWFNPHWDDQRLYEEARRLVVAEVQHITYNEYLPLLIGRDRMAKYGLELQNAGLFTGYDRELNAQIEIAFPTAAFYFISMVGMSTNVNDSTMLTPDMIYNPSWLYFPGFLDGLVQTKISHSPNKVRGSFSQGELFLVSPLAPDRPLDVIAAIIQQGREVGLAPYHKWRDACGLSEVRTFNDLIPIMQPDAIGNLRKVYKSALDIDLFSGGFCENRLPGALVGETFMCILLSGFQKAKRGDRLWYENYFYPSAFTEEQLTEIRKASMARILCAHTNLKKVQPRVLEPPDEFENCPVSCSGSIIPYLNAAPFLDAEPKLTLPISAETVRIALELGQQLARERKQNERDIQRRNQRVKVLASVLSFLVLRPDGNALVRAEVAESLIQATQLLLTREDLFENGRPLSLDQNVLQSLLPSVDVSDILAQLPETECLIRTWPCDHSSPYRTLSGWCNNLKYPERGSSFTTFRRLIAPEYGDGFNSPRSLAVSGQALPSARLVSVYVHKVINREHPKYTHWVMQWGQFLDHDITFTPVSADADGTALDCSDCDSAQTVSINCFPIPIPTTDPFFPYKNDDGSRKCFPFARSLLGQLKLGYRQQQNQITSFIDASNVYGSDDCTAKELRTFKGGKLKGQDPNGELLLPIEDVHSGDCKAQVHRCFRAGDVRVNEQVGLASVHTVWMREHNRLAERFSQINPHWSDERLYQESRRVVMALHQHITFSEFLPKVVGWKMMDRYNLLPESQGSKYYSLYNQLCDPTISNAFATAAYRFGHSLIQTRLRTQDNDRSGVVLLNEIFFNPDKLYGKDFITNLLQGMAGQHSQQFDPMFTEAVSQKLFEDKNIPFSGLDLAALNIQRARDHGLPPYIKYREYFDLKVPKDFDDLYGIMANESVEAIRHAYESVEDIDLFPGIMSESPLSGSLVGPTTAHIISEQFARLRQCDRFWYENGNVPGSFLEAQLAEVRKMTLAKVVCRHLSGMTRVQPQIFSMPDRYQNHPVACENLKDMDLTSWKDENDCRVGDVLIRQGEDRTISPCISCTCTYDGARCHSYRVRNCLHLLEQFGAQAVLADDACLVQCNAFVKLRS